MPPIHGSSVLAMVQKPEPLYGPLPCSSMPADAARIIPTQPCPRYVLENL